MARSARGGAGAAGEDLVVVNEAASTREVTLRTARDGRERRSCVTVETGTATDVRVPDGTGVLTIDVDTDRGQHASLTAAGAALVVVREGSVLVVG